MSKFDARAAQWDSKSRRVQLARDVVNSIIEYAKPEKGIDIADFGTGTGLIMLGLAEYGKTLTGYDNSQGMMDVLMQKANDAGIKNIKTVMMDMDVEDYPAEAFDMITCNMVIHHMDDPAPFFCKAHGSLRTGGKLCVSDLMENDVQFHDQPSEGVKHNGFDPDRIAEKYVACGFRNVQIVEAAVVEKERDGKTIKFPIFLAIGEK